MKKELTVVCQRTSVTPDDAWEGFPPPATDLDTIVNVSCVFTQDIQRAKDIAAVWRDRGHKVNIGGPAFGDAGGEFVPGKYMKKGYVITHRGCIRNCPWCYVPAREGSKIRELEVKEGRILQDNNLLACSRQHQRKVFQMLRGQKDVRLQGGLDARLLTDWSVDEIRSLDLEALFTAYDAKENRVPVLKAIAKLRAAGLKQYKIMVYVMIGFNETMSQAEERLREVYECGGLPFAQLYDRYEGEDLKEWKRFAKVWCRPAAYKSMIRDERKSVAEMLL